MLSQGSRFLVSSLMESTFETSSGITIVDSGMDVEGFSMFIITLDMFIGTSKLCVSSARDSTLGHTRLYVHGWLVVPAHGCP